MATLETDGFVGWLGKVDGGGICCQELICRQQFLGGGSK